MSDDLRDRLLFEATNTDHDRGTRALFDEAVQELDQLRGHKDAAYFERNQLVALLARIYPAGIKRTAIEGWDPEWHGCVYVDSPAGQLSWHYHDREAHLFAHLAPYAGEWDGHTTEQKYERIAAVARRAR